MAVAVRVRRKGGFADMPKGSPKYFAQMDPYGGRISVGKPEFPAQVRAKLGTEYEHLVDEETKKTAKNVFSPKAKMKYLGVNVSKNPKDEISQIKQEFVSSASGKIDPKQYKDAILNNSVTILGLGAGASPNTFAHEFRHNVIKDEIQNRIEDVKSSNSPAQYHANVTSLYNHYYYYNQGYSISELDKIPFAEKEEFFLDNEPSYEQYWGKEQGPGSSAPAIALAKMVGFPGPYQRRQKHLAKLRVQNPYLNFTGTSPGEGEGIARLMRVGSEDRFSSGGIVSLFRI
jgi:hypothetical protein